MHVARIKIENIRGFGEGAEGVDLDLTEGRKRRLAGWTVLAGPNGSGKTTVLEAVAKAVAGFDIALATAPLGSDWVRKGRNDGEVELAIDLDPHDDGEPPYQSWLQPRLVWSNTGWTTEAQQNPNLAAPIGGWFIATYGAARRVTGRLDDAAKSTSAHTRLEGALGMFREDAFLVESITWLKELDYRRLNGDRFAGQILGFVLDLLRDDLLPDGTEITGVGPDGLRVKQRGIELALQSLSHGYRTTAAFAVDLLMRMATVYGEFHGEEFDLEPPLYVPHSGVVLVDEMELHLHPAWQKKIGFWLKRHFPNVQFLVTTHSPFICQAADTLVRLSLPGEGRPIAQIVDEDTYRRVVGGGADDAVVSDLFGLEYPHSDEVEKDRGRLAELEVKELDGTLDEHDRPLLLELQRRLPATPSIGVERLLRKIANDR